MAESSCDMYTLGCIAYRPEGVFFPIETALLAGKGGMGVHRVGEVGYLRLPCYYRFICASCYRLVNTCTSLVPVLSRHSSTDPDVTWRNGNALGA